MTKIALESENLLGFRLDGQQNGAKIADVIKGAKIADVIKGAKIGETEKINIVRGAKIGGSIKD